MTQKAILTNLASLGLGLGLFYALNQHFIGHGAATACQFIEQTQNSFLTEIAILVIAILVMVALFFLFKFAAVLTIAVAVIGVTCLAFMQNDNEKLKTFNFADAKVEKVWSSK